LKILFIPKFRLYIKDYINYINKKAYYLVLNLDFFPKNLNYLKIDFVTKFVLIKGLQGLLIKLSNLIKIKIQNDHLNSQLKCLIQSILVQQYYINHLFQCHFLSYRP
jgi:hypothetical protein